MHNNVGSQNHWLGIKLIGKKANIDAVGARVTYQAGYLNRTRMKVGGGSYLSSHDPRMVLGIGNRPKLDWLEVKWPQPSTAIERFTDFPSIVTSRSSRVRVVEVRAESLPRILACRALTVVPHALRFPIEKGDLRSAPLLSRQLLAEAMWVKI